MSLYTERHGMRTPITKTSTITIEMYSILLGCCEKHYKYLTHIFQLKNHCDFVNEDYIEFHKSQFENRMKIKIPTLFRDEFNRITVPHDYDEYDQYALIDFIEYIGNNIKDISEGWNNAQYRNYWYIECLQTSNIFDDFQNQINEIFDEAGLLFTLTEKKIVERTVENSVLTPEIENAVQNISEFGTKELLQEAILLFRQPNPTARKDSVEKIWDAFERLKTYYTSLDKRSSAAKVVNDMSGQQPDFMSLFNEEFKTLTQIGNSFRIRHHETDKIDITDSNHFDYFFNRCLSLIALAIKYLN